MSGNETLIYTFTDGSYTDTINVSISTTLATVTNPHNIGTVNGQGYPVLSISGTWQGATISGMAGNGGEVQLGSSTIWDNTVFPGTSGGSYNGHSGNTQGIDTHGLEFLVPGGPFGQQEINLYAQNGAFYEITGNQNQQEITFDSVTPSVPSTGSNACFAEGTRIATLRGDVPVEELATGDAVLLHDGGTAPVVWIGRRTIEPGRHPSPDAVQPVVISAHAIADSVPARDLVVSPDHAFYFNGTLIPAKALVNGLTIRQVERRSVTYFHIELPAHAILLAEGMPAESYLDTGNRRAFENGGGGALTLHPEFAQPLREAASCAPFAEHGAIVEQVRMRILGRAGLETTDDAQLQVQYRDDGAAIITSRSAVPAEVTPDPRDGRRLGVKISALMAGDEPVALDHPALAEGWHGMEADGRWTNGAAVVPASLLRGRALTVTSLTAGLRYPVMPGASEARLTA